MADHDDSEALSILRRQLAEELIAQAIHACSLHDEHGVVLCMPEEAAKSVLEHLDRVGIILQERP